MSTTRGKDSSTTTSGGSQGTQSTTSVSTLTGTSSRGTGRRSREKWNGSKHQATIPTSIEPFKGNNAALRGKVFLIGPEQASKYDETTKAILGYVVEKFDHRVHAAVKEKDKAIGMNMLSKPSAPLKTITDPEDKSKTKQVINKDGEAFVEYQIVLKEYVSRRTRLEDNLQQLFDVIHGQCSPSMRQKLEGDSKFKTIKETADSIDLLKLIEKICYSYQPHEYPPLSSWEALDKLSKNTQPYETSEADFYIKIKTMVEVCKASGVNFALICTHTVNMAIKKLHSDGELATVGKYEDGFYFSFNDKERELVNDTAEEICIATRLLSLSSDEKFGASKQELKNDLIKGKDNYPRSVASVLNFLENHNLHSNNRMSQPKTKTQPELAFITDGEKNEGGGNPPEAKVSTVCRNWEDGTCEYKTKHTWSQCPSNRFSKNFRKRCDEKGELLLCTIEDMADALKFDDDDLKIEDVILCEDEDINNEHSNTPFDSYKNSFEYDSRHYLLAQWCANIVTTKTTSPINHSWILLDSQSTVNLFCNPSLLENIRETDEELTVRCNAGTVTTNMVGDLGGFGRVWYYSEGIANILSLYHVATRMHVQYDNAEENAFIVWREDGTPIRFKVGVRGLFYYDTANKEETILLMDDSNPDSIAQVEINKRKYNRRQI